jgi:hypothetical protein
VILVHAGNRIDGADRASPRFPSHRLGAVMATLERLLLDLRPSLVVSAPANGADLAMLVAAQRLGVPTHVVLPLSIEEFRRRSVELPSDERWTTHYDAVLEHASTTSGSTIDVHDLGTDGAWHLRGNQLLLDVGRARLGSNERLVAVTVRPVEGEHPPSATDDFAARAREAGLTVLTIDPRPGRPSDVDVDVC